MDNLKGVLDNAHGKELLAVVAAVHHERIGKTLDDGALSLAESLVGISSSAVRQVNGLTNLNIVGKGNVLDLDSLKGPLVEKLDLVTLLDDLLGEKSRLNNGLGLKFLNLNGFVLLVVNLLNLGVRHIF